MGPHLFKGLDDAPHRPAAKRLIPGDRGREGLRGGNAAEQTDGAAGIAGIERCFGFAKAVFALAGDSDDPPLEAGDLDAQLFNTLPGAGHIPGIGEAADLAFTLRHGG